MARVQRMTRNEISDTLNKFVAQEQKKYNTYAYPAGYLQSVLTEIIDSLPVAKQQQVMQQFQTKI